MNIKHHDPCPCGSGETYKVCCFAAGFNWYWDIEGTAHRTPAHAHPYPQNFAEHRNTRWNTIEQHILKGLRSFIGCTLKNVEYYHWWQEQVLGENAPEGHGVEEFIKLTIGDKSFWIEDDCMLGMLEEFCLTCHDETTPYLTTVERTNVSHSKLWNRFIGQTIDRVSLHGYWEIPMVVEMHFSTGSVLVGLSRALDYDEFDGAFFAAVGTHDADWLYPMVDEIWNGDEGA